MQIHDGEWILHAIDRGTLLIAHDGSFMPHQDKLLCSAGIVLLCSQSGQIGTSSVKEQVPL